MPHITAERWRQIKRKLNSTDQRVPPDVLKLRREVVDDIEAVSGHIVREFAESIKQIQESQNPFPGVTLQTYSSIYFLPTLEMFKRLLEDFDSSIDCVDYDSDYSAQHFSSIIAITFGLNSIGVVRSMDSRHNFNFAIVYPFQLLWVEPQTQLILNEDEIGTGQYKIPGLASFTL